MHLKSGIVHAIISERKLKLLVFMRWQLKKTDFTAFEILIIQQQSGLLEKEKEKKSKPNSPRSVSFTFKIFLPKIDHGVN